VARADRRLIGETVLVNSGTRTSFLIDDEARRSSARETRCRRDNSRPSGLSLPSDMNLKNDAPRYRTTYQGFPRRLCDANPGDRLVIEAADNHVSAGALYKVLDGNQEAGEARRRTARALTASNLRRALPETAVRYHRPLAVEASDVVDRARPAPRAGNATARHDIIHHIRSSTDSEINAAVNPESLP